MRQLFAIAAALLLPLFSGSVTAAEKVAEVEGIAEYRLPNGLRVLLFPDQSKPTITVNMTYLVGSRHEGYGETGMAHLLEHMLFKGTPKIPDIVKEFNARGMRMNGTTSLDRTNYFELFQASEENLDWALQLEADRMVNSNVTRKDLDTEMTVVRNEYESGENAPVNVLIKRMQSVAFDWHNYGNSTIGNRSDIENVEIENLRAFYRMYYQPDNAVLLVAGKFDPAKTLTVIERHFGAIPKPTRTLRKLWTVEPTQDGERSFVVRRVGDLQVIAVAYKIASTLHEDAQAQSFAAYTLGDTPSGRLHKALVETGKAAQVASFPLAGLDGGLQIFLAVVKKGDPIEPVRDELIRQIEDFAAAGPTTEELERARMRFANDAERQINNHETLGVRLSEFIALGDWRMYFQARDRSQRVTAAQAKAAAARYYRRDNRVVGVFQHEDQPQRADLPPVPTVADALRDFKPKAALAAAEEFDPSPANIDKRTKVLKIGGMQVALLAKKTRGETVNVALRLPSGDEKSLFGKQFVEMLTGQMLMRGTSRYSRTQLQDEFTKLKLTGSPSGRGASFETTRPNLVAALNLVAHVLREPAFPASELEQLQKLVVTSIESQLSDPQALASSALDQIFNTYPKGDVRYSPTLQEELDGVRSVRLDDIKQLHKSLYGANRALIAVVGDFNEAEVTKALTQAFAGWADSVPYARITSEFKAIPKVVQQIETPDKENAFFVARQNLQLGEDDADYPALYLANYMMGGGAGMDSRLMSRIRVREGLSYGVGSGLSAGRFDKSGDWMVQAIAAPQNIAKVEAAFQEEVARMLRDGFSAEEIAKAKSGYQQKAVQARTGDQRLASQWVGNLDAGRTFAWEQQFDARVAALTPEQILAAVRRHIDPAKISIVKAGDFARQNKSGSVAQ